MGTKLFAYDLNICRHAVIVHWYHIIVIINYTAYIEVYNYFASYVIRM